MYVVVKAFTKAVEEVSIVLVLVGWTCCAISAESSHERKVQRAHYFVLVFAQASQGFMCQNKCLTTIYLCPCLVSDQERNCPKNLGYGESVITLFGPAFSCFMASCMLGSTLSLDSYPSPCDWVL
jgi:hypothetical protein